MGHAGTLERYLKSPQATWRSVNVLDTVGRYHARVGPDHRYRSWEHCYQYFRSAGAAGLRAEPEKAALHLAFYLASWGMYRGSSFLLQFAYTVHLAVVEVLRAERFERLWKADFGSAERDIELIGDQLALAGAIREAYQPFASSNGSRPASDTLVTKVMLGSFGCAPACDEYFKRGLREAGIQFSKVNRPFFARMLEFSVSNSQSLGALQARLLSSQGVSYPLMKLIDMHFWEWGRVARPR